MQLPQQIVVLVTTLLTLLSNARAGESMDHYMQHHHEMTVQSSGVIMNENLDVLPRDCDGVARDYQFTIHGGTAYAEPTPGMTFGMSDYEIRVEACSRIKITFVNDDEIRHQWMVHGLPKYLYPAGMFHIEAEGGHEKTGTFIVPGEHRNYLIHCDIAQHMEKECEVSSSLGKVGVTYGILQARATSFTGRHIFQVILLCSQLRLCWSVSCW